ncbi:MAG: polyphenol oxidase family protein [Chthoniobacteraceae bacterium]
MDASPVEHFPALSALPGIQHAFTLRQPGLDVQVDREEALLRLTAHHQAVLAGARFGGKKLVIANQVHGAAIAIVDRVDGPVPVGDFDGLITALTEVVLGIYVADCGAVYIVDPVKRVVALLHSGKKGTEQGIARVAIERMREVFRCDPADLVVQLSPCIRPPHYDPNFAAEILAQCRSVGVRQVHDSDRCTGSDLERYYSYRIEKGRTGRMLALLALD